MSSDKRAALDLYAPPSNGGSDPGPWLDEIEFQFNPAELALVKGASWARHNVRSAPRAAMPEFTGSQPRVLAMTLLLDGSDQRGRSVDARVKKLLDCCVPTEYSIDAERPSPPWIRFRWGDFSSVSFLACLRKIQVTYTLFSPQGSPKRAVCEITLEEIGGATKGQNPTSGSPTSRRAHTVVAGDSLASIAYQELGSAQSWRAVAELNGLRDPWRLSPGRQVLLPGREGE
ncbi:CIS tube protein [Streptomyces sp. H27-D2]|uniref:CIS tube protein n=1 Tax=Streptomyces sp. H27-D2 TaxID=3046304 RepID=UPI002DB5B0BB|nr:LysM peptidoglycan-binding domain-containing protein [Streptomyces sp. H27-D2]MEC4017975.1 LysM peptidoglycan-binding domain-containing protein [Streptomyces sp. H27-D2]